MALQSEVSPPLVGDPNKDTKNDGDTKSDENETSSCTDEDVDLEEGEILDSGAEEEEEKKDLTNSSLQEAVDKSILQSIEQLVSQAKSDTVLPNVTQKRPSPHNSPIKLNKRSKYMDHDHYDINSDQEDGWYSQSRKHKSKFEAKPIDYRKELDAYVGTPPSSPDRKHREDKKKKRSSKKSKKSGKKTIKRKDIKGDRVKAYIKDISRRKLCKFYKEGKCAKGSDCGFSHASPHSHKKKELCKFYLSGHCNKGSECIYMHNEFPCKFYHTGSECYAQDACRFSHEPLTDEMKRVLADYLRMHHGDDDFERKRRRSPSPEIQKPPQKRTCLLGSPPRHIREAEETKRWQEEMLQLQHPGFKININEEDLSSGIKKPNFYQETLPDSPHKQRKQPESHNFRPPPFGMRDSDDRFSVPTSNDIFVYEEDYQDDDDDEDQEPVNRIQKPNNYQWNDNIHHPIHEIPPVIKTEMKPLVGTAQQQELDFTKDVKFDETTQFSEMESSTDCHPISPPASMPQQISVKNEEDSSNQETIKTEDSKVSDDSSTVQEPPATPIIVPSHLPKKQQELFKRIQKQELKHAVHPADASSSPNPFDSSEPQSKEEPEEAKEKSQEESFWDSSEDDDDDDTEPLTSVLKNLQKEPPPVKHKSKPANNLMDMLNKIQQKAMEKSKGNTEKKPENFLQSLLGTISAPRDNGQLPNVSVSEPVRRTLLPDPQPLPKKESVIAPKDPRLKNRDPRLAASTATSLPKSLDTKIPQLTALPNVISSTFTSTITTATESIKEEIPYKLHSIVTTPPNYASYISASQNNPNLLKDPRLKKHMNFAQKKINGVERSKDVDTSKPAAKNVPPIPKLLLKYDKSESLAINIFETAKPATEPAKETQTQLPKLVDPRMRRRESQNSSGSNTPPHLTIVDNLSPPHSNNMKTAPILEREVKPPEEKKWLPPVLEKSWTPPVLEQSWQPLITQEQNYAQPVKQEQSWMPSLNQEQSWLQSTFKQDDDSEDDSDALKLEIDENPPDAELVTAVDSSVSTKKEKPTPASHLPRAIADPRMAKLQNPMHSRRSCVSTPESSNKPSELKKIGSPPPNEDSPEASRSPTTDSAETESTKTVSSIPKKKPSSKRSEEKKKTVHRNRKSSMDYASPLNSCNDTKLTLNYNSYNQRPKRTCTMKKITDSSISNQTTNSVVGDSTPDFLSDNSNLDCENSSDVNLKDMFKTIDPTASPFC